MTENNRPKVLLLGNGFTRAFYDSKPWDDLVDEIRDKDKFLLPAKNYDMPTPIKIEMLANGKDYLNDKKFQIVLGELENKKNPRLLQRILDLNFDFILTTNYTYEIECAILGGLERFNVREMEERHRPCEINPYEQNFNHLLYSFNCVENKYNDSHPKKEIDVWHIHGEGNFPQNIVIGQNAYSRLLKSYIDYTSRTNCNNMTSWVNAFLTGDVYILGFGFDFAEIDLWWLLQHKKAHYHESKTIYFNDKPCNIRSCKYCNQQYAPGSKGWCKLEMLKSCNVEIQDIIFDNKKGSYADFYEQAYEYLRKIFNH